MAEAQVVPAELGQGRPIPGSIPRRPPPTGLIVGIVRTFPSGPLSILLILFAVITVVELLVVVAIISVLAALLLPALSKAVEAARAQGYYGDRTSFLDW